MHVTAGFWTACYTLGEQGPKIDGRAFASVIPRARSFSSLPSTGISECRQPGNARGTPIAGGGSRRPKQLGGRAEEGALSGSLAAENRASNVGDLATKRLRPELSHAHRW